MKVLTYPPPKKNGWKALLFDYDAVSSADVTEPTKYALTDRDVQLILAQVDYISWPSRWTNADDSPVTPDEDTLLAWKGDLVRHLMTPEEEALAPYWDDPEGGDLEGNPDEGEGFPWYGDVTFGEGGFPVFIGDNQLEDWLIGAFIAIVSGEQKAVRFLTGAKRFKIALKTGNLGGAVMIFINDILLPLVDTYSESPGLKYVDVITDGAPALGMGAEDLRVEILIVQSTPHTGVTVPQFGVVRKRLWAGEISPENIRYNSDCNCVQSTYDDGETWVDNPTADPRSSPAYKIPVSGADVRCEAAGGMVELTLQTIVTIQEDATALGVANAILAVIAVLTGGAGIIIDLIVAVVEALLAIGALAIQEAFDEAAYDRILCYFYCSINDDGSVDDAAMARLETQIAAEFDINVVVYDVLEVLINLWGQDTLQNAGIKLADSEADCSGCICPCDNQNEYDLTVSDGGFANAANVWGQMHTNLGIYSAGAGWTTTDVVFYGANQRTLDIDMSFSDINVTRVIIEFERTAGNYNEILVQVTGVSGVLFTYDQINPTPLESSPLTVYDNSTGGSGNHILIACQSGYSPPSGAFTLTKVTICYST